MSKWTLQDCKTLELPGPRSLELGAGGRRISTGIYSRLSTKPATAIYEEDYAQALYGKVRAADVTEACP
jgi:hypothetical protein